MTGLVEVEGVALEALLDTGSPVTIIQLEALLQILAEQQSPNQTSIEWRAAVDSRLEPTTVVLRNYSGDRLQVVRQIQVTVSRLEYSTNALIQVQRGAPAKLLIGTDLLSKLGYLFVQASQTGNDNDMLNDDVSVSDNDSKVDVVPQEIQQDAEGGDVIKSINLESEILAEVPLQTVEDNKTELNSGAVCLIQATRIPARHQKLVRAEVKDICFDRQLVTMFEPNIVELEGSFLSAPEALVCLDGNKCTLVLENHGCEPVYLEPGQELGLLGSVTVCETEGTDDDHGSTTLVSSVITESLNEHSRHVSVQKEQERLSELFDLLKINVSGLTNNQLCSLRELISEYSDIFALDPVEFVCTDLITHSIDTGDNPPIRQPLRRIPFALHSKMEELVQKMMKQGVIQHSSSPWSSSVVLVEKKDGSYRFCVDYRRLNAVTKIDVFPLP